MAQLMPLVRGVVCVCVCVCVCVYLFCVCVMDAEDREGVLHTGSIPFKQACGMDPVCVCRRVEWTVGFIQACRMDRVCSRARAQLSDLFLAGGWVGGYSCFRVCERVCVFVRARLCGYVVVCVCVCVQFSTADRKSEKAAALRR